MTSGAETRHGKRRVFPRVIWASVAGLAIAALMWVLSCAPAEPKFQGRSFSEWQSQWQNSVEKKDPLSRARAQEAASAIKQIGTNALPYVLKKLRSKPGGIPELAPLLRIIRPPDPDSRYLDPTGVFVLLGEQASPAIPQLAAFLNETNRPELIHSAAFCLTAIGRRAFPILLEVLSQPGHPARSDVAFWLSVNEPFDLGTNVSAAVPALAKCVLDRNEDVAKAAVKALGHIKGDGAAVALTNALALGQVSVRRAAAQALDWFADYRVAVLPALSNALSDPDVNVRISVTNAVAQLTRQ